MQQTNLILKFLMKKWIILNEWFGIGKLWLVSNCELMVVCSNADQSIMNVYKCLKVYKDYY